MTPVTGDSAAQDLVAAAEEQGRERLALVVRNLRRFHTEAVARVLVDRAVAHRRGDHDACQAYAEMAAFVAGRLEGPDTAGVKARALAELANAQRIHERLAEAAATFARARRELGGATGPDRAHLLLLEAALLRDLGRYDEAARCAEDAAAGFEAAADRRSQTVTLVLLGQVFTASGRFLAAQRALNEAMDRLLPEPWDPRLLVAAYINSVYNLVDMAAAEDDPRRRSALLDSVQVALADVRPFLLNHGSGDDLLQLDWLAARLLFHDGKLAAAEMRYRRLLDQMLARRRPLTAAVLALDLCRVLAARGDLEALAGVAGSCIAVFEEAELSGDLWEALALLRQATDVRAAETVIATALQRSSAHEVAAPPDLSGRPSNSSG